MRSKNFSPDLPRAPWVALLALGLAGLSYGLQADVRLDWSDEGFLWYGVIQTALGQVPIRDFQSYDPARYYWSAWLSGLFGGGILALRGAAALFQALALFFGLMTLRRVFKDLRALAVAAILAMSWQFWGFRFFDSCYPMIAAFFAVRLLERPNDARHLAAGLFAGLTVLVGLNHALYAAAGLLLSSAYGVWKGAAGGAPRKFLFFFAGYGAGLIPLGAMLFWIPGFHEAYAERFGHFGRMLLRGATDVRASVQWPWSVDWTALWSQMPPGIFWLQFVSLWAQAAAFVTLVLFYLFSFGWALAVKKEELARCSVWLGCFFAGLPYVNHVFARGDVTHLGEGMYPVIAGLLALGAGMAPSGAERLRLWPAPWLLAFSLLGALPLSNLFFKAMVPRENMVHYTFGKDRLWIFKRDAILADTIKGILAERAAPREPVFLAPIFTTLYCVLERPSPTYGIYFLKPESAEKQQRTIRELEKNGVRWALVADVALSGSEALKFSNTNTLVWNHLAAHFEALPVSGLPPGYYFFGRKQAGARPASI